MPYKKKRSSLGEILKWDQARETSSPLTEQQEIDATTQIYQKRLRGGVAVNTDFEVEDFTNATKGRPPRTKLTTLLGGLQADRLNLPYAVQNEIAGIIGGAFRTGMPNPMEYSVPVEGLGIPGMGKTATIRELNTALVRSNYGSLLNNLVKLTGGTLSSSLVDEAVSSFPEAMLSAAKGYDVRFGGKLAFMDYMKTGIIQDLQNVRREKTGYVKRTDAFGRLAKVEDIEDDMGLASDAYGRGFGDLIEETTTSANEVNFYGDLTDYEVRTKMGSVLDRFISHVKQGNPIELAIGPSKGTGLFAESKGGQREVMAPSMISLTPENVENYRGMLGGHSSLLTQVLSSASKYSLSKGDPSGVLGDIAKLDARYGDKDYVRSVEGYMPGEVLIPKEEVTPVTRIDYSKSTGNVIDTPGGIAQPWQTLAARERNEQFRMTEEEFDRYFTDKYGFNWKTGKEYRPGTINDLDRLGFDPSASPIENVARFNRRVGMEPKAGEKLVAQARNSQAYARATDWEQIAQEQKQIPSFLDDVASDPDTAPFIGQAQSYAEAAILELRNTPKKIVVEPRGATKTFVPQQVDESYIPPTFIEPPDDGVVAPIAKTMATVVAAAQVVPQLPTSEYTKQDIVNSVGGRSKRPRPPATPPPSSGGGTGGGSASGGGGGDQPPDYPPEWDAMDDDAPRRPASSGMVPPEGVPLSLRQDYLDDMAAKGITPDSLAQKSSVWEARKAEAVARATAGADRMPEPQTGVFQRNYAENMRLLYNTANSLGVGPFKALHPYGTRQMRSEGGQWSEGNVSNPVSARFVNEQGGVTITPEEVNQGIDVARRAAVGALDAGDLEGAQGGDLAATLKKRVVSAVDKMLKAELGDAATSESAGHIRAVAKNALQGFIENALGVSGSSSAEATGRQMNATQLRSAQQIRDMAEKYPAFKEIYDEYGGEANMMRAPAGIRTFDTPSGQMSVSFGSDRGGWSGGTGGGTGGGSGGERRNWLKSAYQTDPGRLLMAQMMLSSMWEKTGGGVFQMAAEYGDSQYASGAISAYGAGERSGAELYSGRADQIKQQWGRVAYDSYGGLLNLASGMSDSQVKAAQSGLVVGGLGIAAGTGAAMLGASAGAALTIAGATAGIAAIPFAAGGLVNMGAGVYNRMTGQDASTGASLQSYIAGMVQVAGQDRSPGANLFNYAGTIAGQEQIATERGTTREAMIRSGTWGWMADWLVGKGSGMGGVQGLAGDIAKGQGLTYDDALKGVGSFTTLFGGTKGNEALIKAAMVAGEDAGMSGQEYASRISQAGSYMGLTEGAAGFQGLAQQMNAMSGPEQAKFLQTQQRNYGMYASWAGYLPGGMNQAYTQWGQAGFTNQAQAGAYTQMLSSAAMYGGTLTSGDYSAMQGYIKQYGAAGGAKINQFISQAAEVGVGDYGTVRSSVDSMLQAGYTPQQMSDLASFSPYEWSAQGRQYGVGSWQTLDAQGRNIGEVSSLPMLQAAREMGFEGMNGTVTPGMTNRQTLDTIGFYKGDQQMQDTYMSGGMRGAERLHSQRMFGFQMQSIGIGFAQIANQRNLLWGSGTAANPAANSQWGIENETRAIQWAGQLEQFRYSQQSMDLSHQFAETNQAAQEQRYRTSREFGVQQKSFGYQTSLMQRGWQRENFDYQQGMNALQHGWQDEDMDLAIRRSSGLDRAQLIKKRDRADVTYNQETTQADKERKRQEELWKREDQRFATEVSHEQQLNKMQESDFSREKQQRDVMYKLDKEHLEYQINEAKKLHALQEQMIKIQREHQEKSLNLQAAALSIQMKQAEEQQKWEEGTRETKNLYSDMMASWRMMAQYAPKIQAAMNAIIQLGGLKLNADWKITPGGYIRWNGTYIRIPALGVSNPKGPT